MPLQITLTRKTYNRGDTLDAADFTGGFVNSAAIDQGQSYAFGAGTAAMPSVACSTDADTGLAWDGNNGLQLISAGLAVGVIAQTGLGVGTVAPDADAVAQFVSGTSALKVDTTTANAAAKLRVRSRGNGAARAELTLENLAADGLSTLTDFVLSSGAPGASYFTDGAYSEAGAIQLGTAQSRPLQTVIAGAVITSHRSDRFEIRPGKDFRLGQQTTTYQAPNCSIIMQDSTGATIYVAAKK